MNKIIVTGGAGFIGSALIRQMIAETSATIINVDKLTYAGNLQSLEKVASSPRYFFERADICDAAELARIFKKYQPDAVMHLAAESHVDRSIAGPTAFIETNIVGTYTLLEAARTYWGGLNAARHDAVRHDAVRHDAVRQDFRFLHVSTDEVYGSLGKTGSFTEQTAYQPNSPYSASKASSDHLVRAWHHTYGLPTITSNCSNNYGPCHFPEKLIPLMILNALAGKPLPIYGKGDNIRDWLYVDDHARALRLVLEKGAVGETYNIGGGSEKTNLEVVQSICAILDELRPKGAPYGRLITFVQDRPGHDLRYAIDAGKIARELGWKPQETFESGLRKTVEWYLENTAWINAVISGEYRDWIKQNYDDRGAA